MSVRQYCRTLTTARPEPHISPQTEEGRVEKICAARKLVGQNDIDNVANLPHSDLGPAGSVRTRDIAAAVMGVSPRYIQTGLRVQRESPELFEKIWNGQLTISAALRILDGVTETESAREIKSLRRLQNAILRDPDRPPNFLKLRAEFLAQFRDAR